MKKEIQIISQKPHISNLHSTEITIQRINRNF